MDRRTVLAAVGTVLAGCSSSTREDPAGTPAAQSGTATPTEDSTPAPLARRTATPEPMPETITAPVSEWVDVRTDDTVLGVYVTDWRVRDSVPPAEHRGDVVQVPAPDKQWVEATVQVRNTGTSDARVSYETWGMENSQGFVRAPDSVAMEEFYGTMPQDGTLPPKSAERYRLFFATAYPTDPVFIMATYSDGSSTTVRFVTDR